MVSPYISQLVDSLKNLKKDDSTIGPNDTTIGINEISKKAGVFYERIRYSIDYREEHTIRRSAIERILSRNLFFSGESKIALVLIQELIRAGYIENHSVLEQNVEAVQRIIDKFLFIEKVLNEKSLSTPRTEKRILSLTATEIELFFFSNTIDELVVTTFFETIKGHVQLSNIKISPEDREVQIYLACRRGLLKNDAGALAYALWLRYIPQWKELNTTNDVVDIAHHFVGIDRTIERQIKNTLSWRLVYRMKNYDIYFSLIREIAIQYGVDTGRVMNDPELLEKEIRRILEEKYKKQNAKTRKSAARAVLYVFCTKMILAFFLELPYDLLVFHAVHYFSLAVNLIFHPLLLLLITSMIRPVGDANTKTIIAGINALVQDKEIKRIRIMGQNDAGLLSAVFLFLYGFIFLFSFGIIVSILQKLGFSVVSILLFTFFLTFVSYFGLRIRYIAKSWTVTVERESSLSFLFNLFALPIIEVGRWFSQTFSSINVFVFIMDFIIETPFKIALEVFDSFVSFLKDKREEIH